MGQERVGSHGLRAADIEEPCFRLGQPNRNHGPLRFLLFLLHVDIGLGRIGHTRADVESRVGRLIVA